MKIVRFHRYTVDIEIILEKFGNGYCNKQNMDLNFWLLIVSLSLIIKCEWSNAFQWNLDMENNLYWAIGCDFHENNLKSEKMAGEKCGEACAQTPGCSHFTWTNFEGGTCWMKTNAINKENALKANEGFVCGIMKQKSNSIDWNNASKQTVWAHACDWKENDLSNSQVAGELCGAECLKTPECTHFTWTTFNGGTCWMKKGSVSK
ncbi:fibroblast growth factor receptor-like, partial [Brachionus plicatilis]